MDSLNNEITIKEVNSKDLLDYLRLRYKAYTTPNKYLTENSDCLDIDVYDFFSRGITLSQKDKIIATMRMVTIDEPFPLINDLVSIVSSTKDNQFKDLREAVSNENILQNLQKLKKGKLPTASYFELEDYLISKGGNISSTIEFSRNAVDPDSRGNGIASTSLLAIYKLGLLHNAKEVIGSCQNQNKEKGFYKKHGYEVIEEVGIQNCYFNGLPSVSLYINLQKLNEVISVELKKRMDSIELK